MELSTTIIRASPTPEEEEVKLRKDQADVCQDSPGHFFKPSRSSEDNHTQLKASHPTQHGYGRSPHSQNGCNFHQQTKDFPLDSRQTKNCSEIHHSAYVSDSGYTSNLNIQHQPGGVTNSDPRSFVKKWNGVSGLGMQSGPPSCAYLTPDLQYGPPVTNYNSHVLLDLPRAVPASLPRGAAFSTHPAQQYLDGEMPPHMSSHVGGGHGPIYPVLPPLPGGYLNCAHIHNPHQCSIKSCNQQEITQWTPMDLTNFEGETFHIRVPIELCPKNVVSG